MDYVVHPARTPLKGVIRVPGDKSISHRAVLLGAISEGVTEIEGFSSGADCWQTLKGMQALGVEIEKVDGRIRVHGRGLGGLRATSEALDAGNAGTMIRLLSGILAGQDFLTVIGGDRYLNRRPMKRIIEPLRLMGADISGVEDEYPPLTIRGGRLRPIAYQMPVASAQVKSCVLLAGLYADGWTTVIEEAASRDHTERMLAAFGAQVAQKRVREEVSGEGQDAEVERRLKQLEGTSEATAFEVGILGCSKLEGQEMRVPGDISAAAFFLVAATMVPDSNVRIEGVGLNPTRKGIVEVLTRMGAHIEIEALGESGGEPFGNLVVRSSELRRIRLGGALIPNLIDELPLLAVAATQVPGEVVIRDAQELRKKETDRIHAVVENLRKMGAKVGEMQDGLVIEGGHPLKGARVDSFGDHRIAMVFSVAALVAEGETVIENAQWADISFPGFYGELEALRS
ncbi:MAG: 3-phosphoshikimate 1-carboxyvinyltransferase [Candidatus Latescibacterota bacterium]